ncbi:glycosyl transferase [Enterococcus saigonensis]|uniref:Glycosyl transferase n=1 Tax=Enterococcus saigonensis TaxID=1805431 RepID=A0A679IMK3_9ENTE|nr:glycosyltransferase family 2 protein [Enterococcus saigonensis]BCA85004.1 glycosyl transferase [Enterococcus saigonensis]
MEKLEMDIDKSLVSVIIPTFNSEKYILKTINSVMNQTYKYIEIIVVDDNSTDETINVVKNLSFKDSRLRVIALDKNSGAAIARNVGIQNSKGKYIAFLDSDDYWFDEKIEIQIDFMKKRNCAFSFTGYFFSDETGNNFLREVRVPKVINYKKSLKNTIIFTSTVMLDVDRLGKELIYMPNVRRGQDTATWWKILKSGVDALGINQSLSIYRRGLNSLSSNKIKALSRTWYLYRNVEKFDIIKSCYYFTFYCLNAVIKRV